MAEEDVRHIFESSIKHVGVQVIVDVIFVYLIKSYHSLAVIA